MRHNAVGVEDSPCQNSQGRRGYAPTLGFGTERLWRSKKRSTNLACGLKYPPMKKPMQASAIAYEVFVRGDPESEAQLAEDRRKLQLVSALRELRENAGLTHAELAKRAGTTAAVIAKLEDPDDDSHSLEKLERIVSALGMQLEIKIVKKHARKNGVLV